MFEIGDVVPESKSEKIILKMKENNVYPVEINVYSIVFQSLGYFI